MTDADNDVTDMVLMANAVVLNMGTLNPRTVDAMYLAGSIAKKNGIPVVFDPVGVGATGYRNMVAESIIKKVNPDVIKGNAGEISYLAGVEGGVRGVDATGASDSRDVIADLARKLDCIVASTGKVDYVSNGKTTYELSNGDDMQGFVSGTGCMASSVVGSYVGACGPKVCAVAAAISAFNVAAEHAAKKCEGPGTFKVALLDSLFNLKPEELSKEARIRKL